MGFFSTYEDDGGASFIGKEEKAALVKNGTTLHIVRAYAFTDAGEYPGPALAIVVDLDGEERTMTFKRDSVPSRDRMINAMIEYFEAEGEAAEAVAVTLVRAGQAFLLRDADSDEV